jgi:hypothetical protein
MSETKEQGLLEFSNPREVLKRARKYLGKDVELEVSTRKDKKYRVRRPDGKWVHFGAYGMQDWTKHKDDTRRERFRQRNARWADSSKWSPSFLSFYLLW